MDEPFSNLDEWMKEEVRDDLKKILRELNATVLFVTHHAADAISFADKIMIMDNGEIIQQGPSNEIIDSPVNSKIAGIFGKVNLFSSEELKNLFGIERSSGNYFVKPEHFEIEKTNKWIVSECIYHGNYYDTDLLFNEKAIHVHLNIPLTKDELIGIRPVVKNIYPEQE